MGLLSGARGNADCWQRPRGGSMGFNQNASKSWMTHQACGQNVSEMPIRVKVEGGKIEQTSVLLVPFRRFCFLKAGRVSVSCFLSNR